MSTQVVRVQGFTKGSLNGIGREAERGDVEHRNPDIDRERSSLNLTFKQTEHGFYSEYRDIRTALNVQGKETKAGTAFEGLVITSDRSFFEGMGWKQGEPMPRQMEQYFRDAYKWAVAEIGYKGTDRNIMSAVVHVDETTPHLQLYYLPITEKWQEKVYAKDIDGHVLRNEKGSPIQAKGEDGKTLYRLHEDDHAPKLARTEFWRVRGGQTSYSQMQEHFHKAVGEKYGLDRGEIGADRAHRTKNQWEQEQLIAAKEKLAAEVEPYREMRAAVAEVEATGKALPFGKVLVDKKELDALKEQAASYAANREDIKELRQRVSRVSLREIEVGRREDELLGKKLDVETTQIRLDAEIAKAPELYELNHQLTERIAAVQKENKRLLDAMQTMKTAAERQIDSLTRENGAVRSEMEKIVQDLTERLRGSYKSLAAIVKATGELKYDDGEYKANLTPEQDRLVEAIANYGEKWAKQEGMTDIAQDIHDHVAISKGISDEIDRLTPHRNRDFEMEH